MEFTWPRTFQFPKCWKLDSGKYDRKQTATQNFMGFGRVFFDLFSKSKTYCPNQQREFPVHIIFLSFIYLQYYLKNCNTINITKELKLFSV